MLAWSALGQNQTTQPSAKLYQNLLSQMTPVFSPVVPRKEVSLQFCLQPACITSDVLHINFMYDGPTTAAAAATHTVCDVEELSTIMEIKLNFFCVKIIWIWRSKGGIICTFFYVIVIEWSGKNFSISTTLMEQVLVQVVYFFLFNFL